MKAFKIRNSSALLGIDLKSTVRILEESCRTLQFQMKANGDALSLFAFNKSVLVPLVSIFAKFSFFLIIF